MVKPQQQTTRKTPLEERNKTLLGLIAIAVLTVLIATMLIIRAIGPGYRTITAEFLQAAALMPKNPVTVSGIHVGTVKDMKLVGDRVKVTMTVRNDVAVGKDSKAEIMITTILGARYVALRPAGGGPLPNNTIDLAHTTVPYDLQEALQNATATFEVVDTDQLAESVDVLGRQIKDMPPLVPRAMENLRTLSTIMGDRRQQFGDMLKTMDAVSSTLRRQQTSIGNMINQGQQLFGEFVARQAAFTAMMQGLTNLVRTLDDVVATNRPQLDALLRDMQTLTDLLTKKGDAMLRSILQTAPLLVRQLTNATGTGNAADANLSNSIIIDSWMCAISGRAQQFEMIQYFKDCK